MAYTAEFLRELADAQGVKSETRASVVKVGRAMTQRHGAEAFLRLLALTKPSYVTMAQIQEAAPALHILNGNKSIGDAMCGDPGKGKHPGLGLTRGANRAACGSRENAKLAIKCLIGHGVTPDAINAIVGVKGEADQEAWVRALPSNYDVLAAASTKANGVLATSTSKEEAKAARAAAKAEEDAAIERIQAAAPTVPPQ